MTPLQARLIIGQLDNVECNTKKRIEKAGLYHHGLSDIPELIFRLCAPTCRRCIGIFRSNMEATRFGCLRDEVLSRHH